LEYNVFRACGHLPAPDPPKPQTEQFIDETSWAAYDVYSTALILVRILFPPLWDGGSFESFSGSFHAAGYDLDAWLRQVIACQ
jgi:hypothetical protein